MLKKAKKASPAHIAVHDMKKSDPTVLTIPLEPSIDTIDDNALHKVLQSEYTCRYLEKIGAKPTRANMELVRKNLPLTKECLNIQLKTRGAIKDEVTIVIPPVAYDVKLPELSLAPTLKKVLLTSNLARLSADSKERSNPVAESRNKSTGALQDELYEDDPVIFMENSTKEFLFPFTLQNEIRDLKSAPNLDTQSRSDSIRGAPGKSYVSSKERLGSLGQKVLNRGNVTPYDPTAYSRKGKFNRRQSSIQAAAFQSERCNSRRSSVEEARQMLQAELKIELSQEFIPRDDDFLVHHRSFGEAVIEWKKQQPKLTIRKTLKHDLINFTLSEIGGDHTMKFFILVVTYLYENYISPPEVVDYREIQAKQTLKIQEHFHRIRSRCQIQREGGLSFTLPILLLSLRVFAKKMFLAGFPLWSATEEGIKAMKEMNDTITELFDPHGFFSSLSILESTSSAVKIMRQHPHRAHRPLTEHFNDTSPLLRSIVVSPQCRETRMILNASSKSSSAALPKRASSRLGSNSNNPYFPLQNLSPRTLRSASPSRLLFDKPQMRPTEMAVDEYDKLLKIITAKSTFQQQILNQQSRKNDLRSSWLYKSPNY